jgi:hypothetical protein
MGKGREPQIILKTDERNLVLKLGARGKFVVKSSSWNENQAFLKDDKLEVAVKSGRLVMAHLPTGRQTLQAPGRFFAVPHRAAYRRRSAASGTPTYLPDASTTFAPQPPRRFSKRGVSERKLSGWSR